MREEKEQRRLEASLNVSQKQTLIKLVRKEFFESSSVEQVRKTMERLKKSFSKEFWAVIKTAIKYGKKATIAVKFRQEIEEATGVIKP